MKELKNKLRYWKKKELDLTAEFAEIVDTLLGCKDLKHMLYHFKNWLNDCLEYQVEFTLQEQLVIYDIQAMLNILKIQHL